MTREAQKPEVGVAVPVGDLVQRVLAPNSGPMTHWGTNTYLVGRDRLCVIDPGPSDAAHHDALLAAIGPRRVEAVLVTHAHRDHSGGARALAAATGAGILAFGPPEAGRSEVMARFAASGRLGGGEGVDTGFTPDHKLKDGDIIDRGDVRIRVLHTPGHFGGHLSFEVGETLLTGDLVMGWASTLISPPDGDLGDFLTSCRRLRALGHGLYLPGHGPAVRDPVGRVDWLIAHREARTRAILATLAHGPGTATSIAAAVYVDIPRTRLRAAGRNVLAHLLHLHDEGMVRASPAPTAEAHWSLA